LFEVLLMVLIHNWCGYLDGISSGSFIIRMQISQIYMLILVDTRWLQQLKAFHLLYSHCHLKGC
jgi:hypothetical protein